MRLSELSQSVELLSDADVETLGQSDSAHRCTLAYCDNLFHLRRADRNPNITSIILKPEMIDTVCNTEGLIVSQRPRQRFFELHQQLIMDRLLEPKIASGIGLRCNIHPSAVISDLARIGQHVSIGANAVIHDYAAIGSHTFIDSGVQVGVDGMLYWTNGDGNICHVKHQGATFIGTHCTLLSNSVVVRAVHRGLPTAIGNNCIIGVGSNIGHEARISSNVVVSNHCVVARSARLKTHSHVGTSSVIREYITVGKNAQVKPGSIVIDNVPEDHVVSGNYAVNHSQRIRTYSQSRKQCRTVQY